MHSWSTSYRFHLGWLLWPVTIAGFLVLRFGVHAPWGVAVAQLFYLTPITLSVVTLAWAASQSPPYSRSRVVWTLLAFALGGTLIGEVAASLEVTGVLDASVAGQIFDGANVAAAFTGAAGLVLIAAIDRLELVRAVRFVLDMLAVSVAAFALLYRVWISVESADSGATFALRMSAYGIGALVLIGCVIAAVITHPMFRAPWYELVLSAVVLISVGLWIWTAASYAGWQHGEGVVLGGLSSVLYMSAYEFAMMAGLYRVWLHDARTMMPPRLAQPSPSLGIVLSTLSLASVAVVAWMVLDAIADGRDPLAYAAALGIATACMVARTSLAGAEAQRLTMRSMTDPVTGGLSAVALPRCFADIEGQSLRDGKSLAALSVGLDDFSRLNARMGYRGGDRVLAAVHHALRDAMGSGARVIRLAGDEFVALTTVADRREAGAVGRTLLAAVREAEHASGVTASIGFAVVRPKEATREEIVADAEAAQTWSKRHGKNRVTGYDRRIRRALLTDERLRSSGNAPSVDMARALLAAIDARDPENRYHARNVAAIVRLVAEREGLEPEHVDRLEMAAVLHDVGKIALPNAMLGRRTLSVRERTTEREHCTLGEQLVRPLGVEGLAEWVRAHHERWDGQGYPDGFAGEDIPFEARLIALADAYDNLTAGRRYGAPMSKAAVLQEIDLGMGVAFDPDLAERFILTVVSTELLGWSDEWPEP